MGEDFGLSSLLFIFSVIKSRRVVSPVVFVSMIAVFLPLSVCCFDISRWKLGVWPRPVSRKCQARRSSTPLPLPGSVQAVSDAPTLAWNLAFYCGLTACRSWSRGWRDGKSCSPGVLQGSIPARRWMVEVLAKLFAMLLTSSCLSVKSSDLNSRLLSHRWSEEIRKLFLLL